MNPAAVILVVFGIGFLSGLRAFTPIALISWLAVWGWMPLAGSPFWFIGTEVFASVIVVLALLELVADKLPKTSPRIQHMPLGGRFATGGLCGAGVAFSAGSAWWYGLVLGGAGSLVGAFSGYYLRRAAVQRFRIPDLV